MKKIILSLAFAAMATFAVHANSINVINTTACDFGMNTGSNPAGFIHVAAGGSAFYASPNNLVNGASAPASGDFLSMKVKQGAATMLDVAAGGSLGIGGSTPSSSVSVSSSVIPDFPACHSGTAYTVTWIVGSTGNITVVIS